MSYRNQFHSLITTLTHPPISTEIALLPPNVGDRCAQSSASLANTHAENQTQIKPKIKLSNIKLSKIQYQNRSKITAQRSQTGTLKSAFKTTLRINTKQLFVTFEVVG